MPVHAGCCPFAGRQGTELVSGLCTTLQELVLPSAVVEASLFGAVPLDLPDSEALQTLRTASLQVGGSHKRRRVTRITCARCSAQPSMHETVAPSSAARSVPVVLGRLSTVLAASFAVHCRW
jgi:hypothetical protein